VIVRAEFGENKFYFQRQVDEEAALIACGLLRLRNAAKAVYGCLTG
jgi:hypothetical protein